MVNHEPTTIVVCHPDDVNLADVKAEAAKYDATVIGNPYVPRGKLYVIDPAALELPIRPTPFWLDE